MKTKNHKQYEFHNNKFFLNDLIIKYNIKEYKN